MTDEEIEEEGELIQDTINKICDLFEDNSTDDNIGLVSLVGLACTTAVDRGMSEEDWLKFAKDSYAAELAMRKVENTTIN